MEIPEAFLDRPVVRFFQGLGNIDVAETRLASRVAIDSDRANRAQQVSDLLNTPEFRSAR